MPLLSLWVGGTLRGMKMSPAVRSLFWPVVLALGTLGCAWLLVDGINTLQHLPTAPARLSMAELVAGKSARWIEVTDGAAHCDRVRSLNQHDVVPVTTRDDDDVNTLLISLEHDAFCATLPTPLRLKPLRHSAYADEILNQFRSAEPNTPVVQADVFELEDDPKPNAIAGVAVPGVLVLCGIAGLLGIVRARRRHDGRMGAVGHGAAAPADGVFDAMVHGAQVNADESVLPAAPLSLSEKAESAAWRMKYLGTSLQMLCAVGLVVLGVWGSMGVVDDWRAWHQGIPVRGELKGETSSKLIVSILDVNLVYQMPGEDHVRSQGRYIMTLWEPSENAGRMRALKDAPDVVTFEEAVNLIPLRIPLLLAAFGLAVALVFGTRSAWRKSGYTATIAATAKEGRLADPSFVEMRTNGAITGYTLKGTLNGKPVTTSLPPAQGPTRMVFADDTGALLVAQSADGALFVPVFLDGEPFVWSRHDLAKAQAILKQRGSPTTLVI